MIAKIAGIENPKELQQSSESPNPTPESKTGLSVDPGHRGDRKG